MAMSAFRAMLPNADSPQPAQNLPRHLIKDEDRLGFQPK
jgi:hypothetical protein